jgi:hypothetical protein
MEMERGRQSRGRPIQLNGLRSCCVASLCDARALPPKQSDARVAVLRCCIASLTGKAPQAKRCTGCGVAVLHRFPYGQSPPSKAMQPKRSKGLTGVRRPPLHRLRCRRGAEAPLSAARPCIASDARGGRPHRPHKPVAAAPSEP